MLFSSFLANRNFARLRLTLFNNKPRLIIKLLRLKLNLLRGETPPFRHIEVVANFSCNLNCEHCSAKTLKNQQPQLSIKDYRKIGLACKKHNVPVVSFTGGDPLVNPKIEEIIKCFHPKETIIGITTNGMLATKKKLKKLKKIGVDTLLISIDSPKSRIHDLFRGKKGSFKKAVEAVVNSKKNGIHPIIITTVHHQNLRRKDGFLGMIELAQKLGVSLHISLAAPVGKWASKESCRQFLLTEEDRHYLKGLRKKYQFIRRDFDSNYKIKGCPAGTERFVILPDGEILACTKIHVSFGNIKKSSMMAIRNKIVKHWYFKETLPRCLCAESDEFIGEYMSKCFNRNNMPITESEFFDA